LARLPLFVAAVTGRMTRGVENRCATRSVNHTIDYPAALECSVLIYHLMDWVRSRLLSLYLPTAELSFHGPS
jgi:hypothetical protein